VVIKLPMLLFNRIFVSGVTARRIGRVCDGLRDASVACVGCHRDVTRPLHGLVGLDSPRFDN